jgi:O-methyltransferase
MLRLFAKGINFLLGKNLKKRKVFISSSLDYLQRPEKTDTNYFDYIRLSTLELVSYEINKRNLKGSVAELGVYKGKFAKYINLYFKDRSLYLFDTFEGFNAKDIDEEKRKGFSSGLQDFTNTSVASVLEIMPFPGKCIPVKGFFPDSAKGIQEQFVFVSIDADLYEPVYEGLKFFYENLVKGGYIFIHDFNNDNYKGARKAVEQFCDEKNICFTPLPDSAGTAIIGK